MSKGLPLAAVALLAAVVGFVVFQPGADARLIGTWEIDIDRVKEMPQFQEASEEEQEMGLQMLKAMGIQVIFTKDKVRLGGPFAEMATQKEMDYRVVESDGGSVTVEIHRNEKWERHVLEIDGDRLTMEHQGRPFPLRRVSE